MGRYYAIVEYEPTDEGKRVIETFTFEADDATEAVRLANDHILVGGYLTLSPTEDEYTSKLLDLMAPNKLVTIEGELTLPDDVEEPEDQPLHAQELVKVFEDRIEPPHIPSIEQQLANSEQAKANEASWDLKARKGGDA